MRYNTDAEVSYYSGVEGGESGRGQHDSRPGAAAPARRAVLPARRARRPGPTARRCPYKILVRRDVPDHCPYLLALLAAAASAPVWIWFRKVGFEARRNAESDYASSSDDDDDDDDDRAGATMTSGRRW